MTFSGMACASGWTKPGPSRYALELFSVSAMTTGETEAATSHDKPGKEGGKEYNWLVLIKSYSSFSSWIFLIMKAL